MRPNPVIAKLPLRIKLLTLRKLSIAATIGMYVLISHHSPIHDQYYHTILT